MVVSRQSVNFLANRLETHCFGSTFQTHFTMKCSIVLQTTAVREACLRYVSTGSGRGFV